MQFSVIIPAYNSEIFLERSIKSVLFQSFKDYELIIVNDGSVDHTEEIAKSFSSKYACVKYVEKKNGGLSSARNAGIKIAQGKYLVFLDSDDKLHSNDVLAKLNDDCKESPDLIIGNILAVSGQKKVLISNVTKAQIDINDDIKEVILKYIRSGQQPPWLAFQGIVNRSFLKSTGIFFNESTPTQEDLLFFFQIAQKVKTVKCVNQIIVDYTLFRKGAITTVLSFKNIFNALKNFSEVYDNLTNNSEVKVYIAGRFIEYIPPICKLKQQEQKQLYDFIQSKYYIIKNANSKKLKYKLYKLLWNIYGVKKGNRLIIKIKRIANVFNS